MRSASWFPCLFLLATLFLGSLGLQAQTITDVTVTGTPVCKPSSIDISFRVTNGTGVPSRFTASTDYTVRLVTIAGNYYTEEKLETFRSTTFPADSNLSTIIIKRTFQIPSTVTNRSNYQILVSSTSPTAGQTIEASSAIFEVKSLPPAPTATNNGPVCVGSTLNLSATTVTGATYSWTGPNGFTSTLQNPSRTNTSAAMAGTYTVTATVNGCTSNPASTNVIINTIPSSPTATNNGPICIGSTATLTASGAVAGERYLWYNASTGGTLLKTSASNTDNTYTTPVLSATTNYWVSIINSNGCESNRTIVTATFPGNSPDSQTTAGTNTWIGHVYDGTNTGVASNGNFTNYFGTYTEAENFNQSFGGTNTCFSITSSLGNRSILTETFSVRYRMNSTKKGLYVIDLGSDDGSRLSVDGTLVYNNWSDQAWSLRPRVLMNLTGTSQLVYDFYENGGGNRVNFNNLTLILENKLTGNNDQNLCAGVTAAAISGDTFGTLPAGLSAAGYQWTYSTSLGGTRNNIVGATSASFTPDVNAAPFNNPGTYYIYRNARLSSSNNVNPNPLVATNESNPAILTVKATPNAPTASNNSPVCVGSTLELSASNISGATYSWTGPNGFVSAIQNPQVSTNTSAAMAGTYTVTATVDGCTSIGASTIVIVNASFNWTGTTNTDWNTSSNWACNSLPTLETNVLIPANLASNNYPVINAGTNALAKNISIENGASVIVNENWLRIAGDLTNSGVLNTETGSISFEGNSAQTIPAAAFQNNRIRNLGIDNTAGVTSAAIIEITGILKVETGNFNTGNDLTLISNATQTALIDGSGNGQVVGLVKMQRYLDVAFGYKYFSSPFSNSVVGDFSSYVDLNATFPNFYRYNENREDASNNSATGWETYTSPTATLDILKGYALNFGNSLTSPKTIEISGTVNNGDHQITLYNNDRLYTQGFNLVGNPYPSPIDWNAAGWTKTNIDDAVYFFTAGSTNMYTGTYTSYVNGVQSGDGLSSNIIPSMQGFFVHVTDTGIYPVSGTLGMTNEVRITNFSQEFLKTPESGKFMSISKQVLNSPEPEKVPLIRINAAFENEVNTDPAVLYFPHFAEISFEKDKDALKLMNTDLSVPNLYSLTPENKKLSINALPEPGSDEVKKIPLGLKIEKDGWMSIGLQDLQNFSANFNVYLIDSEKRIGQNLSRKPQYRFYVKSGQHDSRFYLMFSETEISDPAIAFDEPFSVKTVGGKVMVSMNLETGQKGVLLASTVTGQILDRKNVSEKETIEIEGIKSSGVYFFSINLKDGMFSKKVLIQK
ncbi:hypothetical protein ACKGJN_13160 [Gillisia sp. Q332]|uniref:Ig-like domain-containing protein n=1 Tax=Gillisia xinjiangensis TaxID=3384765 RepID=UPI00391B5656